MAGYPRVTHPSATKLYSALTEISAPHNSVRLACVKHAASVHPEPGSNSRNIVCFPSRTTSLAIPSVLTVFGSSVSSSFLSDLTLTDRSLKFLRIFRVALLFSFQGSVPSFSPDATLISYHPLLSVSRLFLYFFRKQFHRFPRWNFMIALFPAHCQHFCKICVK